MLELLHSLRLDDRVAAAAVHEEDQAGGPVEDLLVLRPSVAGHDRPDAVGLLEQVDQYRGSGEELVLARSVTGVAGDENNLLPFEVGRRFDLQRNFRLVVRIERRLGGTGGGNAQGDREGGEEETLGHDGESGWGGRPRG
jgi:hypothetical protein